MKHAARGFTLIELMVVISIMTLLTSLVLVSFYAARLNTQTSAVVNEMAGIRAEAGLMYLNTGTYDALCTPGTRSYSLFVSAMPNVLQSQSGECNSSGSGMLYFNNSATATYAATGKATTTGQWAVSVPLQNGFYYCADYTGYSGLQTTRHIDNSPLTMTCQ